MLLLELDRYFGRRILILKFIRPGGQVWFLLFAIWFFVFPRISCFTLRAFHSYNLKNIFFLYKK